MLPLSANTDNGLLKLLAQDNEQAFNALYDRYWHKLLAVASHRLASIEDAEEVVQEVFLNLWKRRATLELTHSLSTYLATACQYEILNWLARQQRFSLYYEHEKNSKPLADHATEEWLAFDELKEMIEKTVRALPEKCQLVYRLRKEQHYSEKQIAEKLDISVKTVENQLAKAIKKLRSALKGFRYVTFLF